MNALARFSSAILLLGFLILAISACAQEGRLPEEMPRNWDFSVWVAGATGEENTNSFAEAQTLTAGFFVGKELTGDVGHGWRRGRLEYGFDIVPLFRQFRPQSIYGGGFEPVILRWNSSLHGKHIAPFIELAGGGLRTNVNFPAGSETSNFNFTARGGGGIQIFTNRRAFAEIGCRWAHISNANLGERNPEFNGIQVNLAFHWFR